MYGVKRQLFRFEHGIGFFFYEKKEYLFRSVFLSIFFNLGSFQDPFWQPFWSIFAFFSWTSSFNDLFFLLASILESISASKVSILLGTSFKNQEMRDTKKNTSHGPFLESIFDSKSMKKAYPRDIEILTFFWFDF